MRQPDDAVKRGLAEALQLHAAGRYAEALQVLAARGVLKTASGQSLAGDIHLKLGNPREALKAFDGALRLSPSAAEPYANRGAALLELGRYDEALAAEDRALRLRPEYATAHFNRGNVLRAMGRHEEAVAAYARAIRVRPFAGAHINRGLALGALRRHREALEEFARALRLEPKLIAAHLGRAMAFRDLGQYGDAFAALDGALAIRPDDKEALHFRPSLLNDTERYAEALEATTALITANADDAQAWLERARALLKLHRREEVLEAIDKATALTPQDPTAYIIRAAAFAELGRGEECMAAIDEARRLGANEKAYLPTLALANMALGNVAAAEEGFVRVLANDPTDYQTHLNRSFLHFMTGDWQGGWDDFEWRLRQYEHPSKIFAKFAPKWAGEPLDGKRIVVFAEQGFGDTLQFVRFVPRLVALGAAVTLVPQPGLAPLFEASFPDVEVLSAIGLRQDFDYQISVMSLPSVFRDTLETLPSAPYIKADAARVEKWRRRIGEEGFRVGLIWQGAKKYMRDASRSIPLAKYAPLAAVPGVRLFSVQAQIGLEQLDNLPEGMKITRFGEELENNPDGFREMAAVMANLDLLVMSDTGPTHLAGALGRPVWLALSYVPDWRWMHRREDVPWYPTMRLFRQTSPGDWDGVFRRIAAELRLLTERNK